jgi:hypothetical protein
MKGRSPRVSKGGIECKTQSAKCKMKKLISVLHFKFCVFSAVADARASASFGLPQNCLNFLTFEAKPKSRF